VPYEFPKNIRNFCYESDMWMYLAAKPANCLQISALAMACLKGVIL
jgi:hypothetical protein